MIAARVRANLKMKAVSCVYQKAPHTAFFIKGKGIAAPKDLEGKKLGFSAGNSPKIMFPAFAEANHIDQSKLNWLAADPNSLNSLLLNHQADVILTYLFTLPVLQKSAQNGEQIGTFVYSDFGANFYAQRHRRDGRLHRRQSGYRSRIRQSRETGYSNTPSPIHRTRSP